MKKALLISVVVMFATAAAGLFSGCRIDDKTREYLDKLFKQGSTYTVTFDSQGGSLVEAQTVKYDENAIQPDDPARTGYTFAGWFTEPECVNAWVFARDTVTADVTLYAKWTINQFTVTFDTQSGSVVESQMADYGGTITKPADPTRSGYTFAGWFTEPECINEWDFATDTVTGNTTLYASWTNSYTIEVSVGTQVIPNGDGIFDYGVILLTTMTTRNFTITNTGAVAVSISSVAVSAGDAGNFTIEALQNDPSQEPGEHIHFNVSFRPNSTGEKSATITINYNGGTYTFTVRGTCLSCVDADGDGYGFGPGCAIQDCDDGNPYRYPGAPEICGNYIDDDCDDVVDEGCPL